MTDSEFPEESEIVQTAAVAAEDVVFSRYSRSDVRDIDITVTFEDGRLEVDVYLDAPEHSQDPEQVAEDAVLAARTAVDDLIES